MTQVSKAESEALTTKLVDLHGVEICVKSLIGPDYARYPFNRPISDSQLESLREQLSLLIHQFLNFNSQISEDSNNTQNTLLYSPQFPESSDQDVFAKSFADLKLESILEELSVYDCQLELFCLGEDVSNALKQNPLLPGVILTDKGKFKGIISRQQFWRIISRPYGHEMFLKSPLRRLYPYVQTEELVCNSNTSIITAASRCLQRPPELITEPLAVKFAPDIYKILDVHQLLVAQAHIHKLATRLIKKQADQLEKANSAFLNELEKGKQIQRDFLPNEIPQLRNWEIATCFYPARQVAGDFYDAFMLPGDYLGLVIADVCDKGVGAALFMALFRSLIRVFSGQTCLGGLSIFGKDEGLEGLIDAHVEIDLDQINALKAVALTNNYIAQQHCEMSMFATLFFGVLNPVTGSLTYINGGHEPLFIIGNSGVKASLKPTGPAVGMMPDMKFRIQQVQLEPGEILIGYTDGVTEARDPNGEFFTLGRLRLLLDQPALGACDLLTRIKTNLFTHIDNAQQFDDITLLSVQRLGC